MEAKVSQVNVAQRRILWVLYRLGGKAKFQQIMSEAGMCFGMFFNNLTPLIKANLVKQESFDTYLLTAKGKMLAKKIIGL